MYHIKNDRRAVASAKRISDAFIELTQKKKVCEISISDIQRVSGVSRSTFYRSFDTPEDVIRLMCSQSFDEIFSLKNGLLVSVNCFNYWFDNSRVFELIIEAGQLDYFTQTFASHLIESALLQKHGLSAADYHYFSYMLSYAMAGFLSGWIARGRKETKAELLKCVLGPVKTLKPAMLASL